MMPEWEGALVDPSNEQFLQLIKQQSILCIGILSEYTLGFNICIDL